MGNTVSAFAVAVGYAIFRDLPPGRAGPALKKFSSFEDELSGLCVPSSRDSPLAWTEQRSTFSCRGGEAEEPSVCGPNLHSLTEAIKKNTELIKDSVYEFITPDYPDVEFVFFHGLQPDPEDTVHAFWRTWKMRFKEECWLSTLLPKVLNYTDREIKPRVLSVSYESSSELEGPGKFWASPIDQFDTSEKLIKDLVWNGSKSVGQRHNVPVILVGHDLGGVMVKNLLMKVKKTLADDNLEAGMKRNLKYFWGSVSALVFYATPEAGYSSIDYHIPPYSRSPSLQFLRALNRDAARVSKEFQGFSKYSNPQFAIPTLRIWESAKVNQGRYRNELIVPRPQGAAALRETIMWGCGRIISRFVSRRGHTLSPHADSLVLL